MKTSILFKNMALGFFLVSSSQLLTAQGEGGCGGNDGSSDYLFASTDPGDYERVDRMGMPAIATAVITSKDAYNAADPTDDAAGTFVDEIIANVDFFHTALDDDLTGAGLVPCATADCVNFTAPFVVPDTLKIDTSMGAGFPNGRGLTDPVMDVTLALVLLDMTAEGQDPGTLAGLPLNPPANDIPFGTVFPYLATPH